MAELARISGVTARNIRAYRERGLLDPPRRDGRVAVYDDRHLVQLRTIDQLLRRGFTSAHIAEFFDGVRSGTSLAEFVGLARQAFTLDVEPDGPASAALLAAGLVRRNGARLTWANPAIGAIVARVPDQREYVRFMLALIAAIEDDVQRVADTVSATVREAVVWAAGDDAAVGRFTADHHTLGRLVVADRLAGKLP
ncbi:MerR family transcriptional regulator [Mycobacterium sp. BMJ-28]